MKTCPVLVRCPLKNPPEEARNILIRDTRRYFDVLPRCDTFTSLCGSFFNG